MQIIHEGGHVLAAVLTGGRVENVVLHPLAFSRTDVSPNPSPRWVVWGGPVVGTVFPLLLFGISRRMQWRETFLWRFFAGFCLVANGMYLGMGSFSQDGDPGDLMRLGVPQSALVAFGVIATLGGFALWHAQGTSFGFGESAQVVSTRSLWMSAGLLIATILAELYVG